MTIGFSTGKTAGSYRQRCAGRLFMEGGVAGGAGVHRGMGLRFGGKYNTLFDRLYGV